MLEQKVLNTHKSGQALAAFLVLALWGLFRWHEQIVADQLSLGGNSGITMDLNGGGSYSIMKATLLVGIGGSVISCDHKPALAIPGPRN